MTTPEEKEVEELAEIIYDEFYQNNKRDMKFSDCGREVRTVWIRISKLIIKLGYRRTALPRVSVDE